MKDKKVSIRIVFPFVMSVSIAVCIISCMFFVFALFFRDISKEILLRKYQNRKKTLSQDLRSGDREYQ